MYDVTTNQKMTRVQIGKIRLEIGNWLHTSNSHSFVPRPIHLPFPIRTGVTLFFISVTPCTVHHKYLISSSKVDHYEHINFQVNLPVPADDCQWSLTHFFPKWGQLQSPKFEISKLTGFVKQICPGSGGNWQCWVQICWLFLPKNFTQGWLKLLCWMKIKLNENYFSFCNKFIM